MDSKKLVWFGMFVGSTVGSYIPTLWGSDLFSFSSIIFSAIGAMLGIYICFKISKI